MRATQVFIIIKFRFDENRSTISQKFEFLNGLSLLFIRNQFYKLKSLILVGAEGPVLTTDEESAD